MSVAAAASSRVAADFRIAFTQASASVCIKNRSCVIRLRRVISSCFLTCRRIETPVDHNSAGNLFRKLNLSVRSSSSRLH